MKVPLRTDVQLGSSLPYSAAIFLSAFLLFQVELVLGKYFLPWFGGTPAMWTTCMFFFQSLLVIGYLYAHVLTDRIPLRLQGRIHITVLACALALLLILAIRWHVPILPDDRWKPIKPGNPVWNLVVLLSIGAGIPCFSLSATGPLLQSWFARLHPGVSPYRFYSLSNFGSFLALLTYPFAVEPWLTLRLQAQLWFAGFWLFAMLCGYCALRLKTPGSITSMDRSSVHVLQDGPRTSPPTFGTCVLWLSLSACGSLLFLATTNQVCQNISVVPLLWVLPLSIYLLSMAICFDRPNYYSRAIFHVGLVLALALAIFLLNGGALTKLLAQIVSYALILFFGCMICHGELVRSKPPVEYLTLFYLTVGIGGAMAGVFVVLIAAHVLNTFWEYQFGLWLTALLMLVAVIRDKSSWLYETRFGVSFVALSAAILPGAVIVIMHGRVGFSYLFLLTLVFLGAYVVSREGEVGFSKAKAQAAVSFTAFVMVLLSAVFVIGSLVQAHGTIFGTRNFYGVLTVTGLYSNQPEWAAYKLNHGLVSHGFQFRSPSKSLLATSYYGEESGVGQAVAALRAASWHAHYPRKLHFGVIGLGIGTIAAYAQPGDSIRFYEINPDVVRVANNTSYFTYLARCRANREVVLGDGRLSMERERTLGIPQNFDLLVVDAFTGDAIPVHLLTQQAFQTYLEGVAPAGIIAVHVTNTYLDLRPVLAGIAQVLHLNQQFVHSDGNGLATLFSDWVLLSREPLPFFESTAPMGFKYRGSSLLWTDDYSNLFRVLR